ncbi:MAG TPA: GTPase, partial [Malonomonas sp.]
MSEPIFATVGHPDKGKSSIVETLAQDDSVAIGRIPGTTTQSRVYPMKVDGVTLYTLVDTPDFQRARRALDWMHKHETSADKHPEVVREFLKAHRHGEQFSDECELLAPLMDKGAGILYVVDGSVSYGAEYEAEMEILRWTGQPRMALINPIGPADHVEAWRAALGQYFSVVR